jgi:hypothetical protein
MATSSADLARRSGGATNCADPPTIHSTTAMLLNPAWQAFVRFCGELRHGEIERLKIQDGLPVLAEVTTKKVKFT